MKLKDLEKILKLKNFWLERSAKHKIWTNGTINVAIPHQREINRILAKHILKEIGYEN